MPGRSTAGPRPRSVLSFLAGGATAALLFVLGAAVVQSREAELALAYTDQIEDELRADLRHLRDVRDRVVDSNRFMTHFLTWARGDADAGSAMLVDGLRDLQDPPRLDAEFRVLSDAIATGRFAGVGSPDLRIDLLSYRAAVIRADGYGAEEQARFQEELDRLITTGMWQHLNGLEVTDGLDFRANVRTLANEGLVPVLRSLLRARREHALLLDSLVQRNEALQRALRQRMEDG